MYLLLFAGLRAVGGFLCGHSLSYGIESLTKRLCPLRVDLLRSRVDQLLQPLLVELDLARLLVLARDQSEEAALVLEECAEIAARFVTVHFAEGGVVEGASGDVEALVVGFEGDVPEEPVAQLGLDGEALGTFGVEGFGAFDPAPLTGDLGEPAGSLVHVGDPGYVHQAAGQGQGEVDLEPAVEIGGFAGLLFPGVGFAAVPGVLHGAGRVEGHCIPPNVAGNKRRPAWPVERRACENSERAWVRRQGNGAPVPYRGVGGRFVGGGLPQGLDRGSKDSIDAGGAVISRSGSGHPQYSRI